MLALDEKNINSFLSFFPKKGNVEMERKDANNKSNKMRSWKGKRK